MPENYIELPDTKKLIVFETNQHPDFSGTVVNIQEALFADIPTYIAVADDIAPALNKNIISIWNALPTKRIRIQSIFVYPRTLANHTVTLQTGYINSAPTGGTSITINRHAADFAAPPSPPNTVLAATGATATPIAGVIFGGATFSVNVAGKHILFDVTRNSSALQLRPGGVDGIVLRQTTGAGTTGTLTAHVVFTLD